MMAVLVKMTILTVEEDTTAIITIDVTTTQSMTMNVVMTIKKTMMEMTTFVELYSKRMFEDMWQRRY